MYTTRPITLLVALLLAALTGCTSNHTADPAAMKACSEKAHSSAEQCKTCCREAGASGHMWTSSSGCKCL